MAELPDILELVTPKNIPEPLVAHPLFERIRDGKAPPFLKMSAYDKLIVERQVEEALARLPAGDRRAMEHSVWRRTIGASDDPRYEVLRRMGPGRMGIKALTTCVMVLVEKVVRERKAPADKADPQAPSARDSRAKSAGELPPMDASLVQQKVQDYLAQAQASGAITKDDLRGAKSLI